MSQNCNPNPYPADVHWVPVAWLVQTNSGKLPKPNLHAVQGFG